MDVKDSKKNLIESDLMDKLEQIENTKMDFTIQYTFDIPESLTEEILYNMRNLDYLRHGSTYCLGTSAEHGLKDERLLSSDVARENLSFCFAYLFNDVSDEAWGLYYDLESLSKSEKSLLKKFHGYLRTKYTFDTYLQRLQCLFSPTELEDRKKYLAKIFRQKTVEALNGDISPAKPLLL
jgi:hypothetical protein